MEGQTIRAVGHGKVIGVGTLMPHASINLSGRRARNACRIDGIRIIPILASRHEGVVTDPPDNVMGVASAVDLRRERELAAPVGLILARIRREITGIIRTRVAIVALAILGTATCLCLMATGLGRARVDAAGIAVVAVRIHRTARRYLGIGTDPGLGVARVCRAYVRVVTISIFAATPANRGVLADIIRTHILRARTRIAALTVLGATPAYRLMLACMAHTRVRRARVAITAFPIHLAATAYGRIAARSRHTLIQSAGILVVAVCRPRTAYARKRPHKEVRPLIIGRVCGDPRSVAVPCT